ncbi:MAG: tetratricopeptide repeat protein [Egibacteraceae bacterium]
MLVLGLAVGRFVLADSEAGPDYPIPALDQSLATEIARLEQRTAAQPDDLLAWQQLGVLYTRRAVQVGDPAFYDVAGSAFDKADGVVRDDPATLLGRGNLALSLHDFSEALDYGERAFAALPRSADALGVIVDAEVELGRYAAAAEHLQRMLDTRPGLPALARASYLRELHGDLPGAVIAMRQADAAGAGASFDHATVVALLGDLYWKQGELAAARVAYERADGLAAGIVPASVGRARVLAARGERAQAISLLSQVVDRYPQPAAVILLGELQAAGGRAQDAAKTFALVRTIATLARQAGQVTDLEMALFEADHGDPRQAVELARAAHEARPDNIFANDALAWALRKDGRAGEAIGYAERALRLGTADALLRYHAAEIFAAAGQPDRARDELRRAFDLNPWFSTFHAADAIALADRLGVMAPEGPRR